MSVPLEPRILRVAQDELASIIIAGHSREHPFDLHGCAAHRNRAQRQVDLLAPPEEPPAEALF